MVVTVTYTCVLWWDLGLVDVYDHLLCLSKTVVARNMREGNSNPSCADTNHILSTWKDDVSYWIGKLLNIYVLHLQYFSWTVPSPIASLKLPGGSSFYSRLSPHMSWPSWYDIIPASQPTNSLPPASRVWCDGRVTGISDKMPCTGLLAWGQLEPLYLSHQ